MQLHPGEDPGTLRVETYHGKGEGYRRRGARRGVDPLHCNAELLTLACDHNSQFVAPPRPTKTANEARMIEFFVSVFPSQSYTDTLVTW